jgi:hypothetical protein
MKNLVLVMVVLGLASLAHGAEYSLIVNEFDADASVLTAGTLIPADFPPSRRSRPVTLTPLIAAPVGLAQGDTLTLNLFDDKVYTARIDRISVNVNGTVTVRGRIEGYSLGYVLISTTVDLSLGFIRIPEKGEYYIIQSEPHNRTQYLLDVNVDQLEKLEDGPTPIPPPPTPEQAARMEMLAATLEGGPLDPVNIDVMVVYTPAARQWANTSGGGINNVISQAMENAHLALDNSNTILTMNLVYSAEVSYTESGDSYIDLDRLTYTSDGYMDTVHTLRNQYGADLVVLFVRVEDVGGLGWILNTTLGLPEYGFSLVRVQQASWTYTHIHEMGHNMGCHHRKDQATEPGPGLFSYSAGWRWIGNDSGRYCSVMSYEDGGYDTVAHFSNPSILYRGVATGHSTDGDNARTIREVKNVVSAYRESRPCSECEPEDASLGTIGTVVWGYTVSGNCSNGGKWVGQFGGEAGSMYHFDLCPDSPGSGTANFNADIKITDGSCDIITGEDGICSSPIYLPNDFQWTCSANGTYYVIIAPYDSYGSYTCEGNANNTFTLKYYKAIAGSLQVTLGPAGAISAGAQWNVDGGAWQNSGATVTGLSVGSHTVNYKSITGWTAPPDEQVTINSGQTTTLSRNYTQQTGSLKVTLGPAGAVSAGAQWNVDGGIWRNSDAVVTGLPVGSHTVNYKAISGWTLPPGEQVTINNGQETHITRNYTQPDAPVLHSEPSIAPGLCNIISWEVSPQAKKYYAQCSTDPCFLTVDYDGAWITRTYYEFCGLTDCQEYWYRVKSGSSAWSQTSQQEFQTDTLTDTTATSDGDVVLRKVDTVGDSSLSCTTGFGYFNGLFVTTETILTQIGVYLKLSVSRQIEFVVYKGGPSFSDPYNRICLSTLPDSGTGEKFYSSASVSVPLEAGIHYMIGAVWSGSGSEKSYYYSGHSSPSFATHAGWSYNDYPSPNNLSMVYNTPYTYYHRYTTVSPTDTGSIVSIPINLPAGGNWQIVDFSATTQSGTELTVDVLPANGSTPIPDYNNVPAGADISDIGETTIRLRANLSVDDPNTTPVLHDWSVTYTDPAEAQSAWSDVESSIQVTPGDFEPDCDVDLADFAVLSGQWLLAELPADVWPNEGDGIVNLHDWAVFANAWQSTQSSPNWNPKCDIAPPGGDGDVNCVDLLSFTEQWLQLSADIAPAPEGDGIVDMCDFAVFAENWLEGVVP